MSDLRRREHWVDTAQGKLFAQEWTPLQAHGARTLEGIRAADLQFAEPGQLQRLER